MLQNLTNATKTIRLKIDGTNWTVAAGITDLTSESVDVQGYFGVRFLLGLGAIVAGAVTSIKVRQGTATGMGDAADLKDSKITIADTDDNTIVISEIFRPQEQFLDFVTDRGTQNATIDFLIAELFSAGYEPVTKHATVATQETHISPDEGTA